MQLDEKEQEIIKLYGTIDELHLIIDELKDQLFQVQEGGKKT